MDRLDSMAVFLAALEAGSLSAAARRLGQPLATVSRKVAGLEAALGARLLTRGHRRLLPTEAGQAYAAAARDILARIEDAERAAAGEYAAPKGEIVVAAPVVFGRLHVLPVVLGFLAAHPAIDLRLRLADRMVDLLEDGIDAAIRIGPLPDADLVATRLGTMPRAVYAGPDYLSRHGRPARPEDLAGHACIAFEGQALDRAWQFVDGRRDIVVPIRFRLGVTTAEAAVDAAVSGLGITRVLAYQAADAVAGGRLERLLDAFEPPPAPIHLVHAGQGRMALKLRAFLDFAAPRLRARLRAVTNGPIR